MSQYENYDKISLTYDQTRKAVGFEIILGYLAAASKSLNEQIILDAGCGTGNYAYALKEKVKKIVCVDFSCGMLNKADEKLNQLKAGSHELMECNISEKLPFNDHFFDAIMCNQSLHHLDRPEENFPNQKRFFEHAYRVLKPEGQLIISTITHEQLQQGVWWGELIKPAVDRMMKRFTSVSQLEQLLADTGFEITHRVVPVNAIIQERGYFDPNSLRSEAFRNGDSHFSLLTQEELETVLEKLNQLESKHLIQSYIQERDQLRMQFGQVTFFIIHKKSK